MDVPCAEFVDRFLSIACVDSVNSIGMVYRNILQGFQNSYKVVCLSFGYLSFLEIVFMKKIWVILILIVVSVCGLNDSAFPVTTEDSITYPPKPPETTVKEMVDAGKGLVKETTELGKAMVNGVKEDGGITATLKKHKKFYGSIFIFFVLYLLWLKNRSK